MSNPQQATIGRLGEISRAYERAADEYRTKATEAAQAEADYRRMKAQAIVRAIADGAAVSKAEYTADADKDVANACMDYKMRAAVADSLRAKLSQLRSQLDFGRSVLTSEREADKIHSGGYGGAA